MLWLNLDANANFGYRLFKYKMAQQEKDNYNDNVDSVWFAGCIASGVKGNWALVGRDLRFGIS